jgi:hypothetical protein
VRGQLDVLGAERGGQREHRGAEQLEPLAGELGDREPAGPAERGRQRDPYLPDAREGHRAGADAERQHVAQRLDRLGQARRLGDHEPGERELCERGADAVEQPAQRGRAERRDPALAVVVADRAVDLEQLGRRERPREHERGPATGIGAPERGLVRQRSWVVIGVRTDIPVCE